MNSVLLGHRIQHVESAPAHQPEIAGIERNLDFDQSIEHPVEEAGRSCLEPGLAVAHCALAVHDVGAVIHHPHHLRQQLGRILQIRIDNEDALAYADAEPGRECKLMSVVSREGDANDTWILRRQRRDLRPGAVARAIIDKDEFIILANAGPADLGHPPVQLRKPVFLVITRYDDRQSARRCWGAQVRDICHGSHRGWSWAVAYPFGRPLASSN